MHHYVWLLMSDSNPQNALWYTGTTVKSHFVWSILTHAFNSSSYESETGKGPEFKASVDYRTEPCLNLPVRPISGNRN